MVSLSIRKTIPLMIVTPLVVAIAVFGSLSLYYGRRSINQLSEDLMQSTTNHIQDQLSGLMHEPVLINSINANAIANGELKLTDWSQWGSYFASQLQAATHSNYIYAGSEQGYFVGSERTPEDLLVALSDEKSQGRIYQYHIKDSGDMAAKPFDHYDYDPRVRPWYQAAVAAKQPIWSNVYLGFTAKELLITAAHPIYSDRNQLIGVLGTDMFISQMNHFLNELEVGKTGEVFIVEPDGLLVASSIGETVNVAASTAVPSETVEATRISALKSPEPILRDATQQLLQEYGDLSSIRTNIRITRQVAGQRMFIAGRPLYDQLGLEWLIVVAVPTSNFTGPLRIQTLSMLIFAAFSLTIVCGLGWLAARWIVTPVLQLHTIAVDVKAQQYIPHSMDHLVQRKDEIGQFAGVFSEMAEIISQREESLEEQLKYLRLRAPMPDSYHAPDLSELRTLQQKAKVIREMHRTPSAE
ncbi:MAG: cache domain-containing protein [Cyanobacteria bacterium P01_D01_bin.156]